MMLKNYRRFDFGKSYFRDVPVIELIRRRCRCRSRSASG